MEIKHRLLCLLIVLSLVGSLCACVSKEVTKGDETVLLLSGVLVYYDPAGVPNCSQITGGSDARCQLSDITDILNDEKLLLKETSFNSRKYDYEMVIAVDESEYYSIVQNGSIEDVSVLFALAYSFDTKEVFLFRDEKIYLVESSDYLKNEIGEIFSQSGIYSDTKFFWGKADAFREELIKSDDNSIGKYHWNFSFRYERFWCLDCEPKEGDFFTMESYTAESMEEMILNGGTALGYQGFDAYVADDILTGYWRIEYYDLNSEAAALIYFDNNFQILFGFHIN